MNCPKRGYKEALADQTKWPRGYEVEFASSMSLRARGFATFDSNPELAACNEYLELIKPASSNDSGLPPRK